MELYPLSRVIDVFELVQKIRTDNYQLSNSELNTKIKKIYSEEFEAYYNFNYDIVNKYSFYLPLLDRSYKILLELIEIENIRTLKAYSLKILKKEEFKKSIFILYSCSIFKKKPKGF